MRMNVIRELKLLLFMFNQEYIFLMFAEDQKYAIEKSIKSVTRLTLEINNCDLVRLLAVRTKSSEFMILCHH